jgi:hypothetical protein
MHTAGHLPVPVMVNLIKKVFMIDIQFSLTAMLVSATMAECQVQKHELIRPKSLQLENITHVKWAIVVLM